MKKKHAFAAFALSAVALGALSGCSKVDPNQITIQIRMYKGGYGGHNTKGTDWLDVIGQKYHEYKEKQGLNVVIDVIDFSKDVGTKSEQEILDPTNNKTDLYIINGGLTHDILPLSGTYLSKVGVPLFESMDSIVDQGAIAFDGTVETTKIKDRLFYGYLEAYTYQNVAAQDGFEGHIYSLPWADAVTGLLVNTKVLSNFGITTLPLTSDQLVANVKTIYTAAIGSGSDVRPFVYSGKDAPGYWSYMFNTWFAQYSGLQSYNNFMSCKPASGDIKKEGYLVYQDQGILKSLEAMYQILDDNYCVSGSAGANYSDAQKNFLRDYSAFMANGDWLYKEMADVSQGYVPYLNNIQMMRMPILSCMGPEIGLSTDAQLQQMVSMIDNRTPTADIVTYFGGAVDAAGVKRIADARSIHHTEGPGHCMYIPTYSAEKEYAKEFIRFIYSEDGCDTFHQSTKANLPLKYTPKTADTTTYAASVNALYNYDNVQMVSEKAHLNEIRACASEFYQFNGTSWFGPGCFANFIANKKAYPEGHENRWTPKYIFDEEYKHASGPQWGVWMDEFDWDEE